MTRNGLSRIFFGLKDAQMASERFHGSFKKIGRLVCPGRTVRRQEFRYEHCISGLRSFIKKGQKKYWFCHVFAVEDDAGVCAVTEQFSVSRCDERRQRYGATQSGGGLYQMAGAGTEKPDFVNFYCIDTRFFADDCHGDQLLITWKKDCIQWNRSAGKTTRDNFLPV